MQKTTKKLNLNNYFGMYVSKRRSSLIMCEMKKVLKSEDDVLSEYSFLPIIKTEYCEYNAP